MVLLLVLVLVLLLMVLVFVVAVYIHADAGAVHADANGQLLNCVAVLAQHGLAAESALVWFCFGAGINISHNGGGFSSHFANYS